MCVSSLKLNTLKVGRVKFITGVVALNGKPFLDSGKGKVFQFTTNVSVARELNPGPWRRFTAVQWKSDGAVGT